MRLPGLVLVAAVSCAYTNGSLVGSDTVEHTDVCRTFDSCDGAGGSANDAVKFAIAGALGAIVVVVMYSVIANN